MKNFWQRRAILKKTNYLDLTPIRLVTEEIDANHIVTILIPKFTSRFAKNHVVPKLKSPHIRLKLDVLGSASWSAIDGKKKVYDIADELMQKFGEIEATERLTKFLTVLYGQKLITFVEVSS